MIEYEVSVEVAAGSADAYREWLPGHVEQILALAGFISATTWIVDAPAQTASVTYCVRYRLHDAAALDAYLAEHAPAMRAAGLSRFGDAIRATRRVLRPVEAGGAGGAFEDATRSSR